MNGTAGKLSVSDVFAEWGKAGLALVGLCLCLAAGASAPTAAPGGSPAVRLERAAALSDLRAPGSPPFALRASLRFTDIKGKQVSGRYTLLWISSDRWREEIQVPALPYGRIRVGGKDRYWQVRSTPYERPEIARLMVGVDFVARLREAAREPLGAAREESGKEETCVTLRPDGEGFCFASDGTLVEDRDARHRGQKFSRWQYSDFTSFNGKLFPRVVRRLGEKKRITDFEVEAIEPLRNPSPALFAPPPWARVWETCANLVPASLTKSAGRPPIYPAVDRLRRVQGDVYIGGVINARGTLEGLWLISAPDASLGQAALDAVRAWRYSPATCDGRSIPIQTDITVHFRLGS